MTRFVVLSPPSGSWASLVELVSDRVTGALFVAVYISIAPKSDQDDNTLVAPSHNVPRRPTSCYNLHFKLDHYPDDRRSIHVRQTRMA
jgi:hypothetical protein